MNQRIPLRARDAFARIEAVIILATVGMLGSVLLPSLAVQSSNSDRLICVNNLRRIGTGFLTASEDGFGRYFPLFPNHLPFTKGGTLGLTRVYSHFLSLSNYLETPAILACPSSGRTLGTSFDRLRDANTSYALSTHSRPLSSSQILLTDGDVEGGTSAACTVAVGTPVWSFRGQPRHPETIPATWSATNHLRSGQVLLSDGSVLTTDSQQLRRIMANEQYTAEGETHLLAPR